MQKSKWQKIRRAVGAFFLVLFVAIGGVVKTNDVWANFYTYKDCIDASGGRGDIPSVQEACWIHVVDGGINNVCSAWIGNSTDSKSINIYVDSLTGTAPLAYWGMCTLSRNSTSKLWTTDDNGAIAGVGSLDRGTWGNPTSLGTTLDIAKFVEGLTPVNGNKYTRRIKVHRCHGGDIDYTSCSYQTQDINVIVSTHTLILKAILEDGTSFAKSIADKTKTGVMSGTWGSITRGGAPTGYSFLGFRKNASDSSYVTQTTADSSNSYVSGNATPKETYNEKMAGSDVTRYAVYVLNRFAGRSRVLQDGEEKASTGFVTQAKSWRTYHPNCTVDGCKVTIQHDLKRTDGTGNTTYMIKRTTSNIPGEGVGVIKNVTTETFASGNEVQERSKEYTLYPGQIVCETLIFAGDKDSGDSRTTVCVSVNGEFLADASIKMSIYSQDVTKYKEPRVGTIYGKPGDIVTWHTTYYPSKGQVYYVTKPQKYILNGGELLPSNGIMNTMALDSINEIAWKNAYNVQILRPTGEFFENYFKNNGDTRYDQREVAQRLGDTFVGTLSTGIASLNNVEEIKNTPTGVSIDTKCSASDKSDTETGTQTSCYTKANITAETLSSESKLIVPYNFTNTTEIKTAENEVTFYAGETATIKYDYIINPKANAYTTNSASEKYATSVSNPKWKLQVKSYGSGWQETEEQTQSSFFVSTAEMYNVKKYNKSVTINIPDVPAGTEVCVKSGVYPASSGADTNYTNAEGDGQWAWSEPKCFVVAKKPSIQVWGGNIYSNGIINTARAIKNNLAGYGGTHSWRLEGSETKTVFGSWSELGVVSNGLVSGLASGASVGYGANDNGTLSPPLEGIVGLSSTVSAGGSTKTDYCKQVPLSFANSKCTSNYTGQLGSAITSSSIKGDQSNILTKFDYGGAMNSDGVTALNDGNKIQKETYYYYGTKLTLGSQTNAGGNPVGRGSIQFVHGTEGIYINGNLEYQDGYTKLADVPKLIIYTEKNINIACNVSRIDAILIAGGTVNTCADENGDSPEVNSAERSRQLMINGAVVAAKLEAKRTYGAGPGVNSGVPAEILNFDPTLYRFGEIQSSNEDAGESFETTTNLDTVYQKELAPRA